MIRAYRERAGLSQAELGRLAGISQTSMARMEGSRASWLEKLRRIARVLKVSEQTLIGAPTYDDGAAAEAASNDADKLAMPHRLDVTLLDRVFDFVEAVAAQEARRGLKIEAADRKAWLKMIYEMAWQDCRDFGLEPDSLDLRRYQPAIETAARRRAA